MALVRVDEDKLNALMDLCEEQQMELDELKSVEIIEINIPGLEDVKQPEEKENLDNSVPEADENSTSIEELEKNFIN